MTTLPITPSLLAEAETLAREAWQAEQDLGVPRIARLPWTFPPGVEDSRTRLMGRVRAHRTGAHAALLADLSRPASMDAAARRLAKRVGLCVGATAPTWYRDGLRWALRVTVTNGAGCTVFFDEPNGVSIGWRAPGISAITDPAEAMASALAATEPKENP